jgi:maestro heat-like repeat-containing protein family member 1
MLSEVLVSMLPMLGMAKTDSYKCSFASAMCKFSEAILFYCSNKEKAPDKSIEKTQFAQSIFGVYEIFLNVWIKTNDIKLRQITIESIGNIINIIPSEKLETELSKVLQILVGLYKKHTDQFIVSQSIYMTISAAIGNESQNIDAAVDFLLRELFQQLVQCLDQQSQATKTPTLLVSVTKNLNEILRCFAELTNRFSERILPFFLQKFEQKNEKFTIASLTALKHIINSCDSQMEQKKQLVVSGLKILLIDNNNRIKRHLIQVIVAMGYQQYLCLEGSSILIEFIVKQCSLSIDSNDLNNKKQPEDATNEQLRLSAENILTLFCTTVPNMHSYLWPYLFEFLTASEYFNAANHLCKNLAHIADVKKTTNADDLIINYTQSVNTPKRSELFTRIFVLCGIPMETINNGKVKNRGQNVLNLMKRMASNLYPQLIEQWDIIIPKLQQNLEDKYDTGKFNQKTWEELIQKMLTTSLDLINDDEIICEIGKSFGKQIETIYNNSLQSEEKSFAYKCLGLTLNKTTNKSVIDSLLETMIQTVNHSSQIEREGVATGFGYCSIGHLDNVLLKLETFAKTEVKKSSGGLFSSFIKQDTNRNTSDPELVKATLVLSYGFVTLYAPKDLIISRLEANVLRSVNAYLSAPIKDVTLKQNILKSLEMITKCMNQDHLHKDFNFSYKSTLLNQVVAFIQAEPNKQIVNDIKALYFKICSNIVKLNPKPTEADLFLIIKSSTDSFIQQVLPSTGDDKKQDKKKLTPPTPPLKNSPSSNSLSTTSTDNTTENEDESESLNEIKLLHNDKLYEQTCKSLEDLLITIYDRDQTNEAFLAIFKQLEPWITSIHDHERLRSMRLLVKLLKHFNKVFTAAAGNDSKTFEAFGHVLGRVATRTTDSQLAIRVISIDCIEYLIKIGQFYLIKADETQTAKLKEILTGVKQKLIKNDPTIMINAINDLSKVLFLLKTQILIQF